MATLCDLGGALWLTGSYGVQVVAFAGGQHCMCVILASERTLKHAGSA
jgi:hypothetical protein